jgi:hypothetical protein
LIDYWEGKKCIELDVTKSWRTLLSEKMEKCSPIEKQMKSSIIVTDNAIKNKSNIGSSSIRQKPIAKRKQAESPTPAVEVITHSYNQSVILPKRYDSQNSFNPLNGSDPLNGFYPPKEFSPSKESKLSLLEDGEELATSKDNNVVSISTWRKQVRSEFTKGQRTHFSEDLNIYAACVFIDRLEASTGAPLMIKMGAFELLHRLTEKCEITFRDVPAVATACFFLSNKICVDEHPVVARMNYVLKEANKLIDKDSLFSAAVRDTMTTSSLLRSSMAIKRPVRGIV